jgi:hypothetical protein
LFLSRQKFYLQCKFHSNIVYQLFEDVKWNFQLEAEGIRFAPPRRNGQ